MTQNAIEKRADAEFEIVKLDEAKRRITGFALISKNRNGEPVFDLQGDYITPDALVKAATGFATDQMSGKNTVDDMHDKRDTGRVVESIVLTESLQKALGIPAGTQPIGWLVTVEVPEEQFRLVKSGKRSMFSIQGRVTDEEAA